MQKFILYTALGTLATFAVLIHLSLLPHLAQTPSFANGVTLKAVLGEHKAFLFTLVTSWIVWWSVSGLFALVLHSVGKYTWIVLFIVSLGAIFGITTLIV